MGSETLPISVTHQVQDGCVTASARSFIPELGIPFDVSFLPKLREYSLDESNPENNHMLGVAVVAAQLGMDVQIHRATPIENDILPDNAPARAKLIHPSVVKQLMDLQDKGKIGIEISKLDEEGMKRMLQEQLSKGRYGLIILDWERWNGEAQKRYGNPRHIVTVFSLKENSVGVMDPAIPEEANPVTTDLQRLYGALNEKQQMIFIGKKQSDRNGQ